MIKTLVKSALVSSELLAGLRFFSCHNRALSISIGIFQEKDAAIAKERKDQEEKVEKLRKEHEETRAKYEAKVAEEMDKRREDVWIIHDC